MTIKPQNLLRSLLLIPYFAWGIALVFALLVNRLIDNPDTTNALINILLEVSSFYSFGILLWGIPFTILAVGLLLWSIKKPAPVIFKVFAFSPIMLSILILVEIVLISFWPTQELSPENSMNILSYTLVAVIPTLLFGYSFVGVGILLYQATKRLNLLRTEAEAK